MLTTVGGLLDRMCQLMDIEYEETQSEAHKVQSVIDKMWLYNQTYSVAGKQLVSHNI